MINIFILCYNEEALIRDTIIHYKRLLPSANITIYDNYSTDNSVKIAKEMGCTVIQWDRGELLSNIKRARIRNSCWKDIKDGWIIVCDMDEWLCITTENLETETKLGTTILKTKGYNMLADSKCKLLTDVNLQNIMTGCDHGSKWMAFRPVFTDMKFEPGAHVIKPLPEANIVYSKTIYYFKHNDMMGLPFYINKMKSSFERTIEDRKVLMSVHYLNDEDKIIERFNRVMKTSRDLSDIFKKYS
jgi:hypothetical protein